MSADAFENIEPSGRWGRMKQEFVVAFIMQEKIFHRIYWLNVYTQTNLFSPIRGCLLAIP